MVYFDKLFVILINTKKILVIRSLKVSILVNFPQRKIFVKGFIV